MAISEMDLINAVLRINLIDNAQLSEVRKIAKRDRIRLMDAIMRSQRFPVSAFYQAYAELHQIPFALSGQIQADWDVLAKLPDSLVQRRHVLPITMSSGETHLAIADHREQASQEAIYRALGVRLPVALAEPEALEAAIAHTYGLLTTSGEVDAVALLDDMMREAYLRRASDIHVEPDKQDTRVRLRVDGRLQEYKRRLNQDEASSLLNRIKVLAGMDIAEHRKPQDGGFSYALQDWNMEETDFRVAVAPTRWGERATLRILGQASEAIPFDALGMPEEIIAEFHQGLAHPHGMILVTGPTGSGKSTTLYAALREKNSGTENILTAEDPVEQEIPGISQVACSGKVTFASALRSFLRHDPDVILVGEIRDHETADIAFKAAMTGHLVLSTLHTNDAIGAVSRLVDLGCERFLIADSLIGIVAQRLVRRLCQTCKKAVEAGDECAGLLGIETVDEIYEANGCAACLGRGYKGRVGLYETLWINRDLANAITVGGDAVDLARVANRYRPMWDDARQKVLDGMTSWEEVRSFSFGIEVKD